MRNWTHTEDAGNKGHRKKRKTRPTGLMVTNASIRQVELPGPVKKKGEEDDEAKILRYVTVTPATAKRDSSVRMGKVPLDAQIRCGFLVFSQFSPLNSSGDTPRPQVASLALLCRSSLPSDCPASLPGVKEGLEYYHSLYSPYNRTVQARLFATLR